MFFPDPSRQRQAVHVRHSYIGDDHIRLQLLQLFQGIFSVLGIPRHLETQLFPVHFADDGLAYLFFVIYQHDAI